MGKGHQEGSGRRWVAGALGGALLLGVLGARAVPPPPPLWRHDPHARAAANAPAPGSPEAQEAKSGDEPGATPALIWLLPMAGQLSGAPNAGE